MLDVPDLGYKATIGECVRRAATRWPDRDFVVMPDRRLTFGEAESRSRALAEELVRAGLGKGSRVGLYDTYSIEWVLAWLAVTRIGALAMPFSSIYKPNELRTAARLGDVDTLLAPARMLGRSVEDFLTDAFPGLSSAGAPPYFLPEMPFLRAIWLWGEPEHQWARPVSLGSDHKADHGADAALPDGLFDALESEVCPADLAQVTYTSGSSALPKGVVHSHGAIVRTTEPFGSMSQVFGDSEERKLFCGFPFFWIGGTLVLGGALQAGITVCCIERFEPRAALDLIERERCAAVAAWPSLIQAMKSDPSFAGRDLPPVGSLTEGPSDFAVVGSPVPGVPAHRSMSELVGNWSGSERKAVTPESGEPLPDMAEGELWVRGFGALQGYYKKEREETFDADGWLHTGDRVFMFENRPYFVGRFYEMIKSQGANVSPREIELMLEGWPEIEHALVFGLPHAELEEEVTAVVVFRPGQSMTAGEIQDRARKEVSSFKVPTRIEIVGEDDIPWLGSGKPDKLAVRARFDQAG
jgi:acyl-CoA synthetase (AMP-forming)/AMP-acid ligase II